MTDWRAGHWHNFEALAVDGVSVFVTGLGGHGIHPLPQTLSEHHVSGYDASHGTMITTADESHIVDEFWSSVDGLVFQSVRAAEGYTLIEGTSASETINGTAGNDVLNGLDGGGDILSGLPGDDTILPGPGTDLIDGGPGNDTVSYATYVPVDFATGVGARLDGLNGWGGAAGDQITQVETLIGSYYRDTLVASHDGSRLEGSGGNDTLWGQGGHDYLAGGPGADTIHGGQGFDVLDYSDSPLAVAVDLSGVSSGGDAEGDISTGIEGVFGSDGDDIIINAHYTYAGDGDDTILAGAGNNTLIGEGGDDHLDGGPGDDRLIGMEGSDTFYFNDESGSDIILGWDDSDFLNFENVTAVNSIDDLFINQVSDTKATVGYVGSNGLETLSIEAWTGPVSLNVGDFIF